MSSKTTTTIVSAQAVHRKQQQFVTPVWLRIPEAMRVSGLCRSSIYALIGAGKIKSFTNKVHRDCQRGTRLISYDSLVAYLEFAYQNSVPQSFNN